MHKLIGIKPLVIIMLSMITQLFGNSAQSAAPLKTFPRQVNLSGNIFHFSMPENFSKDMPAADMVETLDINDLTKFDNPEYGNIIRRWWDIKKPGFFGKQLGTVMINISVQRVPENNQKIYKSEAFDITNKLDYLFMLYEKQHQRYESLNQEMGLSTDGMPPYYYSFSSLINGEFSPSFYDFTVNQQRWIGHGLTGPANQLIHNVTTPLSKHTYLEVLYIYSPNDDIPGREFSNLAREQVIDPVKNSLYIRYKDQNPIATLVNSEWLKTTNKEILDAEKDKLLPALFGPDIFQKLENDQKRLQKFNKENAASPE